jgi:tRNA uridine 5-carboxymethylaminomethyl modification enzyme
MDNCLQRLDAHGRRLGLFDATDAARYDAQSALLIQARARCDALRVEGRSAADLLRRHDMTWDTVLAQMPQLGDLQLPPALSEHLAVEYRYEGYIERQNRAITELAQWEHAELPANLDYMQMQALKFEARERLNQFRPRTLGQASRLAGVTAADLSTLQVMLHLMQREAARDAEPDPRPADAT